jgi:predicted AlkP superfamily phosphohydrolase/phosphomutase
VAKRVMIIGLDGASIDLTDKYIREGRLPNIARLMERGYSAPGLPVLPTATTINWTTIATGAWPATHGIVDMEVHLPGQGHPTETVTGFDTRLCQAEYLWNAVERGGKLPLLVRYTCSWPPTVTTGIQVDGDGKSWTQTNPSLLCPTMAYASGDVRWAVRLELRPAEGWQGLPEEEALEAVLVVPSFAHPSEGEPSPLWPDWPYRHLPPMDSGGHFYLLLRRGPGGGYETATLCRQKDLGTAFGVLRPGEWSDVAYQVFDSRHGRRMGGIWFKLVALSPDGREVTLFAPEVFPCDGLFTRPESLAAELTRSAGPYLDEPGHVGHCFRGWVQEDTYLGLLEYQAQWFTKAAEYLFARNDWHLFMMQAHGLDWSMHVFTGHHGIVVEPYPDPLEWVGKNFEIYDRMVGRLVEMADEDTVVMVVADHGAITSNPNIEARNLLEDAGLLARTPQGEIDWSRTQAVLTHGGVWVNLAGRDPGGIVQPGAEYERVRDRVVALLYDIHDPATGKRKIDLAVRREEARIGGLDGERVPDVVLVPNPEFGGNHGELPTVHWGESSLRSLFIMAGPGVKRGVRGRSFWLVDIAPTAAYLIGAPRPRQADGAVLFGGLVKDTW